MNGKLAGIKAVENTVVPDIAAASTTKDVDMEPGAQKKGSKAEKKEIEKEKEKNTNSLQLVSMMLGG